MWQAHFIDICSDTNSILQNLHRFVSRRSCRLRICLIVYTIDLLDCPFLRSSSSVTKKALRTLFHQTRVLSKVKCSSVVKFLFALIVYVAGIVGDADPLTRHSGGAYLLSLFRSYQKTNNKRRGLPQLNTEDDKRLVAGSCSFGCDFRYLPVIWWTTDPKGKFCEDSITRQEGNHLKE